MKEKKKKHLEQKTLSLCQLLQIPGLKDVCLLYIHHINLFTPHSRYSSLQNSFQDSECICNHILNLSLCIPFSQEVNADQVPLQTGASVKKKANVVNLKKSPLKYSDKEDPMSPQSPSRRVSEAPLPQLKTNRKEKQRLNLVPRNVPSQILPSLFSSSEKQSAELKGKNNECCFYKHKTPPAYQQRDRQSIPKLDPSCLPQHFILTEYEIMDNKHTEPKPPKFSALPKPEPKLNKLTLTSLKPLTSSKDQPEKFQKGKDDKVCASKHENERLSTGPQRKTVSLFDSNTVEMNHLKSKYPSPSSRLKPVKSEPAVPLFSVDEVTAGPPPKVTPLFRSRHHDT